MKIAKQIISKYLNNLSYFYKQLGYRLIVMIFLGIVVGIMDGFGLAMFMPLLEMVNKSGVADGSSLGSLDFLIKGLKYFGLNVNLVAVLMLMIFFFVGKGFVKFISFTYNAKLRKFFIVNVRNRLLNTFNEVSYKYFVTSDVGRIQNTMSVEVERASAAFYNYANAIQQVLMVMVYMAFAFFVDIRFALLVSIGGGITNFLYKSIYTKTKGASGAFSRYSHVYQGQIIQYVANFKYLKATALLNRYANRLRDNIHSIEQSRFKIGKLGALLESAREPILIVVVAVVILVQTQLLNAALGPILVSLLFFYRALSSLLNLQNSYNRFLEQVGSLENLIDFQKEIGQQKDHIGEQGIKGLKNSLELRNVFLKYDSVTVLDNVNLRIEKNETVAFVGESGSGKTTLVNVLAGLMPVDGGNMFIDGVNRNQLDIQTYQRRLGYITQDAVIFNDTIFNNVTLWDEPSEANRQRFEQALTRASIRNFVEAQPNKSATILGNDGINLSGGQKQRISIAREIYKDIDVLIMDEATSALDSETEKAIQESVDDLKGKYTILMVAHRLSTIRNADRIVVMNKGQIEQIGTFQQLVTSSILFNKMIELQEL